MVRRRRGYAAGVLTMALVTAAGCRHREQPGGQNGSTSGATNVTKGEVLREPVVPAGYVKVAPSAADTTAGILSQTATVFRGALKDVKFTYDNCGGPRTTYVFSDASPVVGDAVSSVVNVKVLGGPTPRGPWLSVSELPKLALDSEYVVFLRNTDWTFSPIVSDLAFRVEKIGGREVLVHPGGRALIGWGEDGPVLSAEVVSEPVGGVRGYQGATTSARDGAATTGRADPQGAVTPGTRGNAPPAATASQVATALPGAPTLEQVRASGRFGRPRLLDVSLANEPVVTMDALGGLLSQEAERVNVKIGGRVTLEPYWRCWNATPTLRVRH